MAGKYRQCGFGKFTSCYVVSTLLSDLACKIVASLVSRFVYVYYVQIRVCILFLRLRLFLVSLVCVTQSDAAVHWQHPVTIRARDAQIVETPEILYL